MLVAHEHDRPVGGDQPQQREPERGLAGAGFADDAERLALAHRDADAVHRLDVADRLAQHAALDREPDLEIVGSQITTGAPGCGGAGSGFGSAASSARV